MDTARIAELLDPFFRAPVGSSSQSNDSEAAKAGVQSKALSIAQLQHISTYIDILQRWNARVNLTAIRDPEEIVTRHFGESFFAARHLFPAGQAAPVESAASGERLASGGSAVLGERESPGGSAAPSERATPRGRIELSGRAALQGRVRSQEKIGASAPGIPTVADIGSGAGFPGIPLKIWAPRVALTLIESNHKNATFLREVARALTLPDVNIPNTRADTLAGTSFDTVTLRAVERFEAVLPTAASLVAPLGRLALLIGSAQQDLAYSILPSLNWSAPAPIPQSCASILLVGHNQ
jgi:16S rRNA G527 N7-methylase RsmG